MRPSIVVLLLAATSACVSASPSVRPETGLNVPAQWSAGNLPDADGPVQAAWWSDLGDRQLDAVIAAALDNNADVLVAAARVEQAAASARIAGADLLPQAGSSLSGNRARRNFVGFPIPGSDDAVLSTTSTTLGVSLDVSWEIDLWGRLSAQAREGLAAYQASRADLAGVELSVAGQTAKAWFATAEARQQVRLAEQTVASLERSADQVRRRFEQGVRPPLDLRLALSQLAASRAGLETRQQGLDAVSRQLEILVARYPGRDLEFPEALVDTPAAIPAGLPAELVGRRPDLAAAERRLVAADQRYQSARASLYPRLALTASGGTSSNQLGDLVKGDFSVWSLIGNLTAPIFQGGRLRAGVDLAEAGIDEAFARYVGTALQAYAEVETALAADAFLAARVHHLGDATRESRAAQALAENRYRTGLADYVTVLEAQRRSFEAESAHIAGRRQRLDNRIDLYLALGGGFDASSIDDETTTSTDSAPETSR